MKWLYDPEDVGSSGNSKASNYCYWDVCNLSGGRDNEPIVLAFQVDNFPTKI